MKFLSFIVTLLLISQLSFASDVSFYIIYPDGEGDTPSAAPYLANLYEYINQTTKINVTGKYLNDNDDAVTALKDNKVNLAIVSPKFYEQYHKKFHLKPELKTIPLHSSGPYERYYIMAHNTVKVQGLMDEQTTVEIYSSKDYSKHFLNDKVFIGNDEIKKIPWDLKTSENIVTSLKEISSGQANSFVLLTGHEFSVVKKLRRRQKAFGDLKLIFTSRELPSSSLVSIGKAKNLDLPKIKKALMLMGGSLKGEIILKKLRLKGFSQL